MDVVKDNVSSLLSRVVKVAHPDLLEALVATLSPAELTCSADVRTVFTLFGSIYANARTPKALVLRCLEFGWGLLTSPDHCASVVPACHAAAPGAEPAAGPDVNYFGSGVLRAESAWVDRQGAAAEGREFADRYIALCLRYIERREALPATLSTMTFLLRRLLLVRPGRPPRRLCAPPLWTPPPHSRAMQGDAPKGTPTLSPTLPALGAGAHLPRAVVQSLVAWMPRPGAPLPTDFRFVYHRYLVLIVTSVQVLRARAALREGAVGDAAIPAELVPVRRGHPWPFPNRLLELHGHLGLVHQRRLEPSSCAASRM